MTRYGLKCLEIAIAILRTVRRTANKHILTYLTRIRVIIDTYDEFIYHRQKTESG